MSRPRHPPPPPLPLTGLAAVFRAMRRQKGMTQAGLAERTGQTQAYISAIERGGHDMRASTLVAMAAALGCELIMVPKERAAEARRMAEPATKAGLPATLFEEVYVPDPGEDDAPPAR